MKSILFVSAQFLLILMIALYGGVFGNGLQNALMVSGVLLGVWAIVTMKLKVNILPDMRDKQELFMSGPYKYVRHPMYTAVLIVTFSWVLHHIDLVSIGLWLILFVVLNQKLKYEEKLLLENFKSYRGYMSKSKKFIPLVF